MHVKTLTELPRVFTKTSNKKRRDGMRDFEGSIILCSLRYDFITTVPTWRLNGRYNNEGAGALEIVMYFRNLTRK